MWAYTKSIKLCRGYAEEITNNNEYICLLAVNYLSTFAKRKVVAYYNFRIALLSVYAVLQDLVLTLLNYVNIHKLVYYGIFFCI